MKLLTIIAVIILFSSCSNDSGKAKIYQDSVNYYSTKLAAVTDSGFSGHDSIDYPRRTRIFIYKTERQRYIDLLEKK